jgi:hypothetical protein
LLARTPRRFYAFKSVSIRADQKPDIRENQRKVRALSGLFFLLSIGCSVTAQEESPEDDGGATHVAVRIRHVTDPSGTTRADALAGFIRAPASANLGAVLAVSGLGPDVPARGECFSESAAITDFESLSDAELLEVDSVRLETPSGTHELAPFAFPTVADLLRGVVYLSRDQNDATLPAGASYTILGEGIRTGEDALDFAATETSPPPPRAVTISGQPIAHSLTLTPSPVLDLRWEPGTNPADLVVVTLESGEDFWACTFADTEGFGAVPLVMTDGTELGVTGRAGVLGVHRIRIAKTEAASELPPISTAFDFAVEAEISFTESGAGPSALDSGESSQN